MSAITQITAVSALNLRNIPQRIGTSLVIVIGIAGVVAVLISVLSMSTGFRKTIDNSARADRAIILSQGAESEAGSSLSRANVLNIVDTPGIKKGFNGKPIVSAETLIAAPVARRGDHSEAYITLRVVGPEAFALRPEFKLVAGRMFQPAVHELLVGKSALGQFAGVEIGDRITLREGEWTVVGVFTSDGNSHESEFIADADTVVSAYAQNSFNSLTVLLDSPESLDGFKDALTTNPALTVDVKREPEYFATVSKPLNRMLNLVAYTIGGIMAIGALFGALNTMYSAVSSRSTEIAMLRAIGFGGGAVVISVLIEALSLALMGAVIGVAFAYFGFNGHAISTIGGTVGSSQLVYSLTVSPPLMAIGMVLACAIGFLGGLFPAIRAARLPVASALRAT
jgi:putative ABC transport system permease protein